MQNIKKKYEIKIPNDISVIYCKKKKILHIIGPLAKNSLKLKTKIFISTTKKVIKVTPFAFSIVSNNKKKKMKTIQSTTTVLIKQLILESSTVLYKKLKLVGIGFKVFTDNDFKELLSLKLGYSHFTYFKIPNQLNFFCLKSTKIFIYGNSYQKLTQVASRIRSQKKPEPYKGKGILYENEKITLKEGKKV